MRTAAPVEWRGRLDVRVVSGRVVPDTFWMLSGGPDGERVEVVGEDRPGRPRSRSAVAFEPGSLEVADAALDADPEAGEPPVGAFGARGLAAGDEHAVGAGQVLGDADREEAAVEREFARFELESRELGRSDREQVGLVERADLAGDRNDQAACAAPRVLADLGELDHVAELGRRPELALADRPGVGIGHRNEPVGDLLAGKALTDLPGHLARPIC